MSNSFIVEPREGSSKKDDTLILMVNDNGVISVDQDTLQSLILNQSNAAVSVVRLGQTGNDAAEGNITLTVDPPTFVSSETNATNNPDSTTLVDPFMEMDPESLERLETALQSEEAKQILGENVTAMLDMLTVEEQQNSLRYSIELDHCYTSRSSSSQLKLTNPLPDISLSDVDESACVEVNRSINASQMLSVSSSNINNASATLVKQKITPTPPKIVKQPGPVCGRQQRSSNAMQPVMSPKIAVNANVRMSNLPQEKVSSKNDEGGENDEFLSSSESSASEETDSDSDFGPRSSRRGVRSRGGRRGLTTRGGSMAASRRRASSKHMDSEQVRRLDIEMAAAVSAMKSPEKEDKSEKHSPGKIKKFSKPSNVKKKEEITLPVGSNSESALTETNVIQTTNQVKANLIHANMFKGDMILTKPGHDRNNKTVLFAHKPINLNDIKNLGLKKQVAIPKNKLVASQSSKLPIIKDIQIISAGNPAIIKNASVSQQPITVHHNVVTTIVDKPPCEQTQSSVQVHKGTPTAMKIKPLEIRKEKKKVDGLNEARAKAVTETVKAPETKASTAPKKIVKKEHRKSDTHVVEALGPALFSTPDIIRRVGSTETRTPDSTVALSAAINVSSTNAIDASVVNTSNNVSTTMISTDTIEAAIAVNVLNYPPDTNTVMNDSSNTELLAKLDHHSSITTDNLGDEKMNSKSTIEDLLQPTLDPASKPTTSQEIPSTVEQNHDSKPIGSESAIESDDHFLATLGMDSAKQLANDEDLLAEALLLQETLGVDLDQSGLVDPTAELPEPILSSSSVIEPPQALPVASTPTINVDLPKTEVFEKDTASPITKTEAIPKKDTKEPIQIIRGGRVITLPPIEAPATRSKRLQTRSENQVKVEKKSQQEPQFPKIETTPVKSERTPRASAPFSLHKQDMIYNMEDEEEEEEEEPNSDSEDDPNRLWCICRQPHNNRFMICCDMCQDWFHGKCVSVTKAMGEQMEKQGIEWVCPNCSKKKGEENKSKLGSRRQRNSVDSATVEKNRATSISDNPSKPELKASNNLGKNAVASPGVTHCVVCKKEARKSSIYCSDACILAHAETTSSKPTFASQLKTPKTEGTKIKSDSKIMVFDKRTGKVITDADAPTTSNLRTWLKEHPMCEVVKPNNLNTIQLGGKAVAAIQTQGIEINKPIQGKFPGQAKMIYTKMPGSKQTVLAASTKKAVPTPDALSASATASPQRQKQTPAKFMKQTTIKTSMQNQQQQTQPQSNQQLILQKPIAASTPKSTASKKPQEVTKPTASQQKQQQQTPLPKKPEAEKLRLTVRKMLADVLIARIKEAKDLNLSEEEIIEIALQIELEMYKFFKDTGSKYKSKYRSLVFNVKDPKNLTLFRKIADRSLSPDAVVKLSPEEMASQELAEWREKETKHQLEMIKKNELDMMTQAKSIVVKTHKGEQIIENDGGNESIDLKTPVQDIVTALNSGDTTSEDNEKPKDDGSVLSKSLDGDDKKKKKKKKEKDRDREKRRNRSRDREAGKHDRSRSKSRHRHRERSRDTKSKKEKYKGRDRTRDKEHDKSRHRDNKKAKEDDRKDKHKRSRSSSRSHSKTRNKDLKEKPKQQEEGNKKEAAKGGLGVVSADKPIEERLWRHIEDEMTTNTLDGNDSDISDREPSSTVTIKTPDINDEFDKELEFNLPEVQRNEASVKSVMTVWRGTVHMAEVAKFSVTAQNVSGNSKELLENLPGTLDVVGRISPATVWDYIAKMKKHPNKEIVIIKLAATNDEEKIPYITLYSYLNSRNRLGVVGGMSQPIKDFYIMPFSHNSKLPPVLLPIDGPGFEENRQHSLLGIMVVHSRVKRLANAPPPLTPIPAKIVRKEQLPSDRSYTPPPPLHLLPGSFKEDSQDEKHSFSVISKIVPELSSKITLESSSSSDKMHLNDDEDEPYSPGEPVDLPLEKDDDGDDDALASATAQVTTETSITFTTVVAVSPSKSSTELQRKMDEISRQIEEEKMQIQNISSSFLGDSSTTLPGLGLDPADSHNARETYSPSDTRSFTPPPPGISKLSQPILEKVSNITIPPNLQEILANVKRQESSKVDPYLPSKPGATFLTTNNSSAYSPAYCKATSGKSSSDVQSSPRKETKSTLSLLSDYDLMKKAEEELAALAAADAASTPLIPTVEPVISGPPPPGTSFESPHR